MKKILLSLLPDFETMPKNIFITHADVDHTGLLPLFDEILTSASTRECLVLEASGQNGFREQNPLHRPYVNICKTLTSYLPPDQDKIQAVWDLSRDPKEPLEPLGVFDFGEMHFEVYQGKGGHLPGETVLIDYTHKVAFTGDIFVNLKDKTPRQLQ